MLLRIRIAWARLVYTMGLYRLYRRGRGYWWQNASFRARVRRCWEQSGKEIFVESDGSIWYLPF